METLKYTVIKSEKQYNAYCHALEQLLSKKDNADSDEVELLTLLIEKWDEEHNTFEDLDPVELLKSLMQEHGLKAKDLVGILQVNKATVSKMLHYQKGLSKTTIRKLADYFNLSQEAFNRPYKLVNQVNRNFRNASLMNTKKDIDSSLTA